MGGLGSRPDDVLILDDCDTGVRKLAEALGWLDELETLWAETNPDSASREEQKQPPNTRDEELEAEVAKLTGEIQNTLKLSEANADRLREHLENRHDLKQGPNKEAGGDKATQKSTASTAKAHTEEAENGEADGSDSELDKRRATSAEDALEVQKDEGKALL